MLIDARSLPVDTVGRADVCVVGAGAAGITLAMELRDRGLEVLLIESGGAEIDAATTDLYAGESVGNPIQSFQTRPEQRQDADRAEQPQQPEKRIRRAIVVTSNVPSEATGSGGGNGMQLIRSTQWYFQNQRLSSESR